MDRLQEKPTVPYPPVGADGGQSLSQKPNQSIAEEQAEHKPQERDFREILRQIDRVNDPAYLPSLSMNELYEKVYPGKPPVVEGLLYPGVYLFVGAPKVGKSFLMAQLAYHVSKGLPLWGYEVRQGAVLYMALEDDYPRLQGRLYRMFGEDSAADLHLSIYAKQLNSGLEEQLMAVYKEEKTNTWRAVYRYTDWNGERKQTQKRGFKTKREAQAWEREQLNKSTADLDMTFKSFVDLYTADMKTRLKENTWATKDHIIRTKLLPYFGKLKMCNITAQQIITWQNEMLNYKNENGKPYSPVYLKTVHNQLSAIFNHAVRYYNLRENPCKKAGSMGKKKNREMMFWTKEQYLKFAEAMMDKPQSFYAFEMLYWCGIREGELLALTPADFDFEKGTVSINKSYQRLNGQDLITTPKTEKSNRVITMPQFLTDEIQDYLKMLYGIGPDDRMFTITKSYLHREMDRGAKEAGVPRIRIHDIRHSAVSLLIDMGFSATAIADRVGHESIDITYNYAHLFPSKQTEMADKLNMERGN